VEVNQNGDKASLGGKCFDGVFRDVTNLSISKLSRLYGVYNTGVE